MGAREAAGSGPGEGRGGLDVILPASRAEAKAVGAIAYFTGQPCKNGHVAERFTINGGCKNCQESRRQKFKTERREDWRSAQRDYRERNRDRERERQRKWTAENREQATARVRNHFARLNGCEGSHTGKDVLDILAKQQGKCAICDVDVIDYHVDHIVPVVRKGSNDPSNLQILCPPCNRSKGGKDLDEFMRSRGIAP